MFVFGLVWYALFCVLSSFCNHLEEEERDGCFAFIFLWISCYLNVLWLFLGIPFVVWSAVYDCRISKSYSLFGLIFSDQHIHIFYEITSGKFTTALKEVKVNIRSPFE